MTVTAVMTIAVSITARETENDQSAGYSDSHKETLTCSIPACESLVSFRAKLSGTYVVPYAGEFRILFEEILRDELHQDEILF